MSGHDRATKNTRSVITSLVVGIFERAKHIWKANIILYKIGMKKNSKKELKFVFSKLFFGRAALAAGTFFWHGTHIIRSHLSKQEFRMLVHHSISTKSEVIRKYV